MFHIRYGTRVDIAMELIVETHIYYYLLFEPGFVLPTSQFVPMNLDLRSLFLVHESAFSLMIESFGFVAAVCI